MEKLKLKSRDLSNQEKYKIAEYFVDEYNDTFSDVDDEAKLTMEEVYDDFDDAGLLVAYDFPTGEVFIVFGTFYETEDGVEKAIDEFLIGLDGEVNSANDYE